MAVLENKNCVNENGKKAVAISFSLCQTLDYNSLLKSSFPCRFLQMLNINAETVLMQYYCRTLNCF